MPIVKTITRELTKNIVNYLSPIDQDNTPHNFRFLVDNSGIFVVDRNGNKISMREQ